MALITERVTSIRDGACYLDVVYESNNTRVDHFFLHNGLDSSITVFVETQTEGIVYSESFPPGDTDIPVPGGRNIKWNKVEKKSDFSIGISG